MIELCYVGRSALQPCHFGEYGVIYFWEEENSALELAQQMEAILMGWA